MSSVVEIISLIGIPIDIGQPYPGVALTPSVIDRADIIKKIQKRGDIVVDHGDEPIIYYKPDLPIQNANNPRGFHANSLNIARRVSDILCQEDTTLISIGGDHSMSTGTILGHREVHRNLSVIWVDAHADIHTPASSTTGNIHGMPLAFLVDEMRSELPPNKEFDFSTPILPAENLAYIGLRAVDPYEKYMLEKLNIKAFTIDDIDEKGIEQVMKEAIYATNPNMDRFFHLSFDVDALDPSVAPSTGTPVDGGLTLKEGIHICQSLYDTGKLAAVDIAEINPELSSEDGAALTLDVGRRLILASLGLYEENE